MILALALQDAVYIALKDLAGGRVYYAIPADAPLPFIYFGDDDLSPDYDNGGDFTDVTVNVSVYASDKIDLKTIVAAVIDALDVKLPIDGYDVMEWRVGPYTSRQMEDGLTYQADLEFDYLIQAAA